jgi:hypothetical protein
MAFEHRSQPPISRRRFAKRLVQHGAYAVVVVGASLAIGVAGYHWIARFSWVDSLLNASMLLGGMGPVGDLPNDAAKLFAAGFALYSGLVFLVVAGLLLAPIFHRVLHRFHWNADRQR